MSTRMGRPPRLSREQIVTTARALIEQHGVDALTMRRLAAELGATPMAVYHHVRDREQLLLMVMGEAAAGMQRPQLPADPRERMVAAALAMHDTLAPMPGIVEVLTADDLLSPDALWYPEKIVDAAIACGLSADDAVHAYRTIWYYTVGEILVRASAARRAADSRPTFREQAFAAIDPDSLPRLAAAADRWAGLSAMDTYEQGLRALVRGLLSVRER
jgi:AcrR family transcriptional regulator